MLVAKSLVRFEEAVSPSDKIIDHMHQWMKHQIQPDVMEIFANTMIGGMELAQIVALYEAIETSMSVTLLDSVKKKYCVEMSAEARAELLVAVGVKDDRRGLQDAADYALIPIDDLIVSVAYHCNSSKGARLTHAQK